MLVLRMNSKCFRCFRMGSVIVVIVIIIYVIFILSLIVKNCIWVFILSRVFFRL